MTKNGVCYQIEKSPYKFTIDEVTFYFSSLSHKTKFCDRFLKNRVDINTSISKRFEVNFISNILCDVVLYKKIETRGFLIEKEGLKICQNLILSNGEIKIMWK